MVAQSRAQTEDEDMGLEKVKITSHFSPKKPQQVLNRLEIDALYTNYIKAESA